jgi:hypothetical protein
MPFQGHAHECLPRLRDPVWLGSCCESWGKVGSKQQVNKLHHGGSSAFIKFAGMPALQTPHLARTFQVKQLSRSLLKFGKHLHLTGVSHDTARELLYKNLDQSISIFPRKLGVDRAFGYILPMHFRGGQSNRNAGIESPSGNLVSKSSNYTESKI